MERVLCAGETGMSNKGKQQTYSWPIHISSYRVKENAVSDVVYSTRYLVLDKRKLSHNFTWVSRDGNKTDLQEENGQKQQIFLHVVELMLHVNEGESRHAYPRYVCDRTDKIRQI